MQNRVARLIDISTAEYRALAEFRYQIRRFLHFSEEAARRAGLEPQQHQLLLAVKSREPEAATVGMLAERLQLRHHSVVGLIDRLEARGLVRRSRSEEDRRSVVVTLTREGEHVLRELSIHHREELKSAIPGLIETLTEIQNGAE